MTTAGLLASARRVLVTGLQGLDHEAVTAACDLAELLGAAIDAGDPELARAAGPTVARIGRVTADAAELARADLLVFWFCAADADVVPSALAEHPAPSGIRQVLAVGPAGPLPGAVGHVHVQLGVEVAVEAARGVHALVDGRSIDPAAASVAAACRTVYAAVERAECVAFITDDASDPTGLEAWALVHLVRTIAHRRPAFEVTLRRRPAVAETVSTWRYGAAGAIARADRCGAEFLPGEAAAVQLVERGEVDAVIVVGAATAELERALAGHGERIRLVRLHGPALVADLRTLAAQLAAHRAGAGS